MSDSSPAPHSCATASGSVSRSILWSILLANAFMFILELWQGLSAGSSALLTDAADFFADAFAYGVTLLVIGAALKVRARAARLKALLMVTIGLIALVQGGINAAQGHVPAAAVMGWVGCLALLVNIGCAVLLFRTRNVDSNMQSIWLCSRNDVINNLVVIAAAALVWVTGTLWPDLMAATAIFLLQAASARRIWKHSSRELHHVEEHH